MHLPGWWLLTRKSQRGIGSQHDLLLLLPLLLLLLMMMMMISVNKAQICFLDDLCYENDMREKLFHFILFIYLFILRSLNQTIPQTFKEFFILHTNNKFKNHRETAGHTPKFLCILKIKASDWRSKIRLRPIPCFLSIPWTNLRELRELKFSNVTCHAEKEKKLWNCFLKRKFHLNWKTLLSFCDILLSIPFTFRGRRWKKTL